MSGTIHTIHLINIVNYWHLYTCIL